MITVVLLARNEAHNLAQVLPLLRWADQTIVVDDESSDDTVKICLHYGARVLHHPLKGDFSQQRNFALSHIKSGWVLFLDPDERLSEELVEEIKFKVKGQILHKEDVGYTVNRIDVFLGKKLRFGETKDTRLVRLGLVGCGLWQGKVHEVWHFARTEKLKGEVLHYSHQSIKQLFDVVNIYGYLRARELQDKGNFWNLFEQVTYPSLKFVNTFFLRFGFLDGWRGFIMSIAMAWHSFLVRWYLWDLTWLKRPWGQIAARYLLVIPWMLLPFGQLARGQLSSGGSVYLFEVFMALACVWYVILKLLLRKTWIWPPWAIPFGLFSLILGISGLLSPFSLLLSCPCSIGSGGSCMVDLFLFHGTPRNREYSIYPLEA